MENKNKRRICEICNKTFANGKALGGHIRSHFTALPIAPKHHQIPPPPPPPPPPPSPKSLVVSSSSPEKSDLSNAESFRSKSKRCCKENQMQSETLSFEPETFPDEEVAMCLLKLKSDKWTKEGTKEDKIGRGRERDEDGYFETSIYVTTSNGISKSQLKYKCRTCNKRFRTYQALGGHRASHKTSKMYDSEDEDEKKSEEKVFSVTTYARQGSFECPFCDKVFESGKALGGHKKVHFGYLAAVAKKPGGEESGKRHNFLDLNLVPDEEEDGEFNA